MAKLQDRLFAKDSSMMNPTLQAGKGLKSPMVNAFVGGQNGPMTDNGRYVNNSSYVKRQLISRVVEFPLWTEFMPDPQTWRTGIKTFFEVQTKIDGLQKGLTAEFTEQEIGRTGKRQFDVSKVTEQQSDITHSMTDKYGQPYKQLFTVWLRYGMMDPESGIPLISVINENVPDHLPDMYSATVLYFEPDPLYRYVQNAWLQTNMAPRGNGPDEGSKDLSASGQTSEMSIGFTSLQQTGYGVIAFAQAELDKMNRNGLNPLTRKAFVEKIDEDVLATSGGYYDQTNDLASQQM